MEHFRIIYACNRLHWPVTSTVETRTSGVNGQARRGALLVAPEDLRALCCTPERETADLADGPWLSHQAAGAEVGIRCAGVRRRARPPGVLKPSYLKRGPATSGGASRASASQKPVSLLRAAPRPGSADTRFRTGTATCGACPNRRTPYISRVRYGHFRHMGRDHDWIA